jgi:putative endonuclease
MAKIPLKIPNEVECPEPVEGHYYVYLLSCVDSNLYCGSTKNLKNRLQEHNSGEAAVWTKMRRPVKLVYYEAYDSLLSARRREKQIKGWTIQKKTNLIYGIWTKLSSQPNTKKRSHPIKNA